MRDERLYAIERDDARDDELRSDWEPIIHAPESRAKFEWIPEPRRPEQPISRHELWRRT